MALKIVKCPWCGKEARITYEENRVYQMKCYTCHNSMLHEDRSFDRAAEFFEHHVNLLQAEQDGRLVVLPCKVGDTVYVIDRGDYTHAFKPYVRPKPVREISWKATSKKDLGWGMILSGGDCGTSARYKLSSIGKTVFLTREEAEAALKGGHES